ncbi:MAG: molybdenum cofactor guanylyltransferase [Syntrophobacterales bacterium]|jgi:molybdopterin-guanine dinucleotide biosynthesis protein A|nr:molybdenum cofactor guanylyltransferase [Syntrophobacterales bacterium]
MDSIYTDRVTGVILSGGENSRMGGRNKAFIEFEGERLIDRGVRLFQSLFAEVILVTNSPQEYFDLDAALVTDIYRHKGALGGIHAGLFHASCEKVFFAACDMPFLNEGLIKHMIDLAGGFDILVPQSPDGLQPLHAIYSRKCLPVIEKLFSQDRLKIIGFYPGYTIHKITADTLLQFDPSLRMFSNFNSLEEMQKVIPENNG